MHAHNICRAPVATRPRSRGFTLIELMVGLVLGMLAILVITAVMASAEGKKRTVAMGSDAQVNGALALYTLQTEIQTAGYGASSNKPALGCQVKGKFTDPDAAAGSGPTDISFTLVPVEIVNGVDGAPDSLTVLQSQTSLFSAPIRVVETHDRTQDYFLVQSSLGVAPGDLLIAVPPTPSATEWCTMFAATNNTGSAATTLSYDRIPHTAAGNPAWNHSEVFPEVNYAGAPIAMPAPQSYLLSMGNLTRRTYTVSSAGNLQVTGMTSRSVASTPSDLFPNIVNFQAMYGKDTDANGIVDRWDSTTPTNQAEWAAVLAVRIAIVARSTQYEKEIVTTANPQWDIGGSDTTADVTPVDCTGSTNKCIPIKVDNLSDWKHYRYKVYDSVIPLRNMLWSQ